MRVAWVLAVMLLAGPRLASAAPPVARPPTLRAVAAELASAEAARVQAAIEALAASRHPYAVVTLTAFLREGQPDLFTDHALAALALLGQPSALGVLAEFTHHRRAEARRESYRAIAAIEAAERVGLLAEGLRDSDPRVRGTCAEALGHVGTADVVDTLFHALSRGVPEAAEAIGRIGDARSVLRMHEHLGRQPLTLMLAGYEAFLRRMDLDEASKLDIVARLGEVAAPAVKRFLQALLSSSDWKREPRVRASIAETAQRIAESPPTPPPPSKAGAR